MISGVAFIMTFLVASSLAMPEPQAADRSVGTPLEDLKEHEVQRRRIAYGCESGTYYSPYNSQRGDKAIVFPSAFRYKPHLIYGIIKYDNDKNRNSRINIRATSLTKYGFTLHFEAWSDTHLYSVGVSWMACP